MNTRRSSEQGEQGEVQKEGRTSLESLKWKQEWCFQGAKSERE